MFRYILFGVLIASSLVLGGMSIFVLFTNPTMLPATKMFFIAETCMSAVGIIIGVVLTDITIRMDRRRKDY